MEIVHVGRLEPVKSRSFTPQVAKALGERGVPCWLSLIGRGSLENEVRAAIEGVGNSDHVVMLGPRTVISELISGADVMLMRSHYEGVPLVMVEAQAAGLACFVSDRITPETDMGLGLVRLLPLVEPSFWAESLVALASQPCSPAAERGRGLRENGLDVVSDIYCLEESFASEIGVSI